MLERGTIFAVILIGAFVGSFISTLFTMSVDYPLRRADASLPEDFDYSFWDLSSIDEAPLEIANHSETTRAIEYQSESFEIVDWRFSYFSSVHNSVEIRIRGIFLYRLDAVHPIPPVLVLHGYGSEALDFMGLMEPLAAEGFAVLGIDAPDCGESTAYPKLNPLSFLNVSTGPQSAHLYHSVWAAARAITLLESLTIVDTSKTAVLGASMGGLQTFILGAIDDRIDACIPMIAAGNLENSLLSGSFLNTVINPEYGIDSEEMQNIFRWFDPLAYSRYLTLPTFMIFGTNDEFFPLTGFMDTIDSITSPLTLSILPNTGHRIHPSHGPLVADWLSNVFLEENNIPHFEVTYSSNFMGFGTSIHINVDTNFNSTLYIHWRGSEPGAAWIAQEMLRDETSYYVDVLSLQIGKITFFVSTEDSIAAGFSSEFKETKAGAYYFPIISFLSTVGLVILIRKQEWTPSKEQFMLELPVLVAITMIAAGMVTPFFGLMQRTTMTFLDFLEIYGVVFRINGWLLPAIMIAISTILSLSALALHYPLKLTVVLWIPLLILFLALYMIFAGFFAFFGGMGMIYDGPSVYLLLSAVPVLIILETYLRKHPPDILIDIDLEDMERQLAKRIRLSDSEE